MSAGAHDLLFEALERRFDNRARRTVLIIGAGRCTAGDLSNMEGGLGDDLSASPRRGVTPWP